MPTTTIVLAMHGAPPSDFARDELAELEVARFLAGRIAAHLGGGRDA